MVQNSIIHQAFLNGVKKLLFLGSSCIYPKLAPQPMSEDALLTGKLEPTNEPYAVAKIAGIKMCESYNRQYGASHGIDYRSVMPTNLYGPGDNYNLDNGHVIPSLIHKMYLANQNNTDFVVWGSGSPLREFIFSEDVAELTMMLYEKYDGVDPVILSTSEEISIKDIVLMIAEIFEFKGNVIFDSSKPDGQLRKPSDNSVIKSMFPDYKFTPIETGLRKSITWFIENYENIRK